MPNNKPVDRKRLHYELFDVYNESFDSSKSFCQNDGTFASGKFNTREQTSRMSLKKLLLVLLLLSGIGISQAQEILSLEQALSQGQNNYLSIKAKQYIVDGARSSVSQTSREYLPNLVVSAQNSYGTINGQNGPLFGLGGFAVASSGLPLNQQNWNAAFGSLYLANINWELFTFGRTKERIKVSEASLAITEKDLQQERFQHEVRVAAAYLNLLASQRLVRAQEKNLERAAVFRQTAVARARSGLIAGVDSALANAEWSNAKIGLIKAKDFQQEEAKKIAVLIGSMNTDIVVDSVYIAYVPLVRADSSEIAMAHPTLEFYRSRVDQSNEFTKFVRRSYYPSFNLFGVIQTRGSGFQWGYTVDQTAFTRNYVEGIKPSRTNYLVGAGLVWNITSLFRVHSQAKSASYNALSSQSEYELAEQQLNAQFAIAEEKYKNALETYYEVPVQVASASDAYHQKLTLYRNGLTTIVDVTQTLYILNRAETDRDIAYINVWQALLMKAAASGNFELFRSQVR